MSALSTSSFARDWLTNFSEDDQSTAIKLLDRIMLVGAGEFTVGIITQLDAVRKSCVSDRQWIALYAEREMEKAENEILPFFPGFNSGRATGNGIQPVNVDLDKPDVGSEGIVATLVSKYCKLPDHLSLSHPGPNSLRENRVRLIVIVTDFIGSGRRISEMLDAFGNVATIQSWISYGFLKFHVISYSGTENGLNMVRQHKLRPSVSSHIACPVIEETFRGSELGAIKQLCQKYPKGRSKYPFGFNNTGSLIAFSHGIPNNAPTLLHSSARGWKPLFVGRSTLASQLDAIATSGELLIQNSERVLGLRNAKRVLRDEEGGRWLQSMLILEAIVRGARTPTKLSALTQVPISNVVEILDIAKEVGWVTPKNSITRLGRREIKTAQVFGLVDEVVAFPRIEMYFPSQLRAR